MSCFVVRRGETEDTVEQFLFENVLVEGDVVAPDGGSLLLEPGVNDAMQRIVVLAVHLADVGGGHLHQVLQQGHRRPLLFG